VFAVNTDGSGFNTLHSFTGISNFTNSDGTNPSGDLILCGTTLYGTTENGGSWGRGTVFKLNTDGTGFRTLYNFSVSNTCSPNAGLILSGSTLYGTTQIGYPDNGAVFSLSLPPQLTIVPSATNILLTWPTNAIGFTLQSTTNLGSPVWTTNSPTPVVVNGQNTVTNLITGTQQFYRLIQ
jgi:uncharacterized repeat protein (TIGR03803 family)